MAILGPIFHSDDALMHILADKMMFLFFAFFIAHKKLIILLCRTGASLCVWCHAHNNFPLPRCIKRHFEIFAATTAWPKRLPCSALPKESTTKEDNDSSNILPLRG